MRGEGLEEIVRVGLRSIHSGKSFTRRVGIAYRLERDAQVIGIRQGVENLRRNRVVGQSSEEERAVVRACADAAVQLSPLASGTLLERGGARIAIRRHLCRKLSLSVVAYRLPRPRLRALADVPR